jgi:2,5-dioxopentanoate dehydrogenase
MPSPLPSPGGRGDITARVPGLNIRMGFYMPLHGQNFIGHSLSAEGADTFQSINPATSGKLDPPFHNATRAELDRALFLADQAFQARRRNDAKQTAFLLDRIAAEIEALGEELFDRGSAETGLPPARIKSECARTTGQLRLFADVVREGSWVDARIDRPLPDRKPLPKPGLRRMLLPLGPVVVFPASNFPLAFSVAGGDSASAWAAGCPVIVKARPTHAGTSELVAQAVAKAMLEANMPDGWFSMLHGAGREAGVYLVKHPVVKAVGFTGSIPGGRALFDVAASRPDPIPVYAEMGSNNPVFLLPGALAERAEQIAQGLHQSITLGVGQFCTNPGLIIAMASPDLEKCLGLLAKLISETPPGVMLMEPIRKGYESAVSKISKTRGVECLAKSAQAADPKKTQCLAALLVTDASTFLQDQSLREEMFGPATVVVKCRSRDEMLEIARGLGGQLTATIHAAEAELAAETELLSVLEAKAGRLLFNGYPTGVEVCASMNHGGPYPATTDVHCTSVGTAAIFRFARPLCYQNLPQNLLPPELRDKNEMGIWRLVDNVLSKEDIQI